MKKFIFFILLFFIFFSFPPKAISGGINSEVIKYFREEEEKKIKEEIPPPAPEIIVDLKGSFPKEVVNGFPLVESTYLVVGLKDKKTGQFVLMPGGTKIVVFVARTTGGDERWKGGEWEVPPEGLLQKVIWGNEIKIKELNEISESKTDFFHFVVRIILPTE